MTTSPNVARPGDGARAYGGAMSRTATIAIVAVVWMCAMFVQNRIDTRRHLYNPTIQKGSEGGFVASLRNNMFGASMLGFREVVAGMLWVKADELFHSGKYQELVPYFSMVTFMDPHQIDVYSTGAWHLMYNFGDPRMVPQGLSFLQDGIKNNPTTWDLYFQRGWVTFDWPVEDYKGAEPFFREAMKHESADGTEAPPYVSHMVAHALARQGNIEAAKDQWRVNQGFAEKRLAEMRARKDEQQITYWQQERDVCRNNLNLLVVREAFRKGLDKKPIPVALDVKWRQADNRVLEVAATVKNMPELFDDYGEVSNARLEIILQDKDYDKLVAKHGKDFSWIGKNLTRYRSLYNIVERNGVMMTRTGPWVRVELNKDPMLDPPRNPADLYPLVSEQYELIVRLDPKVKRQPEAVQDKFGWLGEGMKLGGDVKAVPGGGRILEKRILLKRDDIV